MGARWNLEWSRFLPVGFVMREGYEDILDWEKWCGMSPVRVVYDIHQAKGRWPKFGWRMTQAPESV